MDLNVIVVFAKFVKLASYRFYVYVKTTLYDHYVHSHQFIMERNRKNRTPHEKQKNSRRNYLPEWHNYW